MDFRFTVAVVLALLLGGTAGYLIGERHPLVAASTAPSAPVDRGDGRSKNRDLDRQRPHTFAVPQNPNTMGGTFNPSQAGGASGGGNVDPGAGGETSDAPTSASGASAK